jgi:hypothetical protein
LIGRSIKRGGKGDGDEMDDFGATALWKDVPRDCRSCVDLLDGDGSDNDFDICTALVGGVGNRRLQLSGRIAISSIYNPGHASGMYVGMEAMDRGRWIRPCHLIRGDTDWSGCK